MEPIQVVLLLLAAAGVWAVVELALVFRKLRGIVASLDKTVDEVNGIVADARPIVGKLEETVDNLQPTIADLDPVVVKAGELVDAASADLLEINVLLRDVSGITGSVSSASSAVSNVADAATDKVQRLFGLNREEASPAGRTLETPEAEGLDAPAPAAPATPGYYTYGSDEEPSDE